MRAIVHDRYGAPDVLRLEDVERPLPKEDEVLVRVRAAAVSRTDCGFRSARPIITRAFTGLRRPKRRTLGSEFAGEVEAVGAAVREFAVGDRVFGTRSGAHAEYICVRETRFIAHMPAGLSFEEAAGVSDGGLKAIDALQRANLRDGQTILVNGASGAIGTAAVQLAKHLGAHVTGVCDPKNLELVRSLGADRVIDYTQEDFTKNGETYDVLFDAVGKRSFRRCRGSIKKGGIFLPTDGFEHLFWALWTSRIGNKKVLFLIPHATREDLVRLKDLIEAGKFRPVVDRSYALEDVVDATRYVETGQKTGNVILVLNGGRA